MSFSHNIDQESHQIQSQNDQDSEFYEAEQILNFKKDNEKSKFLVKWKNYSIKAST